MPTFVHLAVGAALVDRSIANGPLRANAQVIDPDAGYVGEILVWVEGGQLSAIEYAWITDVAPTRLPPAEWLSFDEPRAR
jgi:hypothetical protein